VTQRGHGLVFMLPGCPAIQRQNPDIRNGRAAVLNSRRLSMSEFSDARLATVFQAGRCIGFILLRGLSYEATDATGAVSLGFYPSQREAAAALQQSTSRPRRRSASTFRRPCSRAPTR
jgi:hypothetical protein